MGGECCAKFNNQFSSSSLLSLDYLSFFSSSSWAVHFYNLLKACWVLPPCSPWPSSPSSLFLEACILYSALLKVGRGSLPTWPFPWHCSYSSSLLRSFDILLDTVQLITSCI